MFVETQRPLSYFGEVLPSRVTTFASDEEAEQVIQRIVAASGLMPNFEIKAAAVPNAAAVIDGSTRYILYDRYFVQGLTQRTGTKWAAISVMAHEIGHHLNGHTLDKLGSRPHLELEADYYSGFILQRMGATLDEARMAIDLLGAPRETSTHPAKHDRLAAITNGWMSSCRNDSNCRDRSQPSQTTDPQTSGKYTVKKLRFFEKGPGNFPPPGQRAYSTRFEASTARYIPTELHLVKSSSAGPRRRDASLLHILWA